MRDCHDVLELWRGRLHVELQILESLDTQLASSTRGSMRWANKTSG